MSNIPTGTTLNGHSITYWNRQTEADGDAMSSATIMPICSAINDNIKAIETMQAATDVINVYGTYSAFESESGEMVEAGYLTDYDIVKVLKDETRDTQQTYYQYSTATSAWTFIGSLDPYYSKSEISTNYLKANNVTVGKNITITKSISDDGPTITIGTKDDVSFNAVSSTGFSGMNISGNSKTATIYNLITSAEGASAWINNNTTNNSANSAINATNADHTKDVITSYYAIETQAGTQTAIFNVSSLKLSGNKTAGIEISKTTNNNVDYLYFKLNSETVCDYVEEQNKYVKYTDSTLKIGDTDNLGVTGAATALGKYASASNYSFALCFGDDNNKNTVASNKGFAVGDTNSAAYNSFIIGHNNLASGANDASNKFIIGVRNTIVNTATNSYIIGSNNTNNQPGLIILGNNANTNHNPGDILAVGNGNGGDCLLINPTAFKFRPAGTTEIHLNEYGLYNNYTEKLYSWNEVLGLGVAVEHGDTILTPSCTCSSTDQLLANNILIYGDVNDDTYAFYVSSATPTLTNYSHTFRLYTTVISTYKLKISVPDTYDILLKCFSDNGWGFTAAGGTNTATNIRHKKGSITNSYKPSDGLPYANTYTTGNPLSLWYPHDNAGSAHYFYFQQLWGGQYIDVTVDSKNHTFIMRKGGGDV